MANEIYGPTNYFKMFYPNTDYRIAGFYCESYEFCEF